MSFTDQKPRVATKKDREAPWGGYEDGSRFRCYLCGHKFQEGDLWRWVSATHLKNPSCTNFLVCNKCDGENVIERWHKQNKEARERFWWLIWKS